MSAELSLGGIDILWYIYIEITSAVILGITCLIDMKRKDEVKKSQKWMISFISATIGVITGAIILVGVSIKPIKVMPDARDNIKVYIEQNLKDGLEYDRGIKDMRIEGVDSISTSTEYVNDKQGNVKVVLHMKPFVFIPSECTLNYKINIIE